MTSIVNMKHKTLWADLKTLCGLIWKPYGLIWKPCGLIWKPCVGWSENPVWADLKTLWADLKTLCGLIWKPCGLIWKPCGLIWKPCVWWSENLMGWSENPVCDDLKTLWADIKLHSTETVALVCLAKVSFVVYTRHVILYTHTGATRTWRPFAPRSWRKYATFIAPLK